MRQQLLFTKTNKSFKKKLSEKSDFFVLNLKYFILQGFCEQLAFMKSA